MVEPRRSGAPDHSSDGQSRRRLGRRPLHQPGGNDYSEVAALNAATGTKLWSVPIGGAAESGARIGDALAVANGVVYVRESGNGPSSSGGHLYALDAATGTDLWSSSLAASTPAVVNGVLYAASETNGQVCAFHLPRGQAAANRPSPTSLHPDYRLPTTT